jgi:hypothetical protein
MVNGESCLSRRAGLMGAVIRFTIDPLPFAAVQAAFFGGALNAPAVFS